MTPGLSWPERVRLAAWRQAHPQVEVPPPVGGIWRAWIPAADYPSGRLICAFTLDDLLLTVDAALAAG